jgi:hypothetical protein
VRFDMFLTNSLILVFQSKHSSNLGWSEYSQDIRIQNAIIEYVTIRTFVCTIT